MAKAVQFLFSKASQTELSEAEAQSAFYALVELQSKFTGLNAFDFLEIYDDYLQKRHNMPIGLLIRRWVKEEERGGEGVYQRHLREFREFLKINWEQLCPDLAYAA